MSMAYPIAPAPAAPKKGRRKVIAIVGAILLLAAFAGSQALAYYKVTKAIPLVFTQTIHEDRYDLAIPANWDSKVIEPPSNGATSVAGYRFSAVHYSDGESASVTSEHADHKMGFSVSSSPQSVEYIRNTLKCTYSNEQVRDITWNGTPAKISTVQVNCEADSPLLATTGIDGVGYGGTIEVLDKDAPVGGVSWVGSTPGLAKAAQKVALGLDAH